MPEPDPTRERAPLAAWLALAACCAFPSCRDDGGAEASTSPAVRRIAMSPAAEVELGEVESVGDGVTADADTWALEAPGREGVREVLGRPCAIVEGMGAPKTIVVPAPEGAAGFTGVALDIGATDGEFEAIGLEPLRGGRPVAPREHVRITCKAGLRPLRVDFRRVAGEADALRVTFAGHSDLGLLSQVRFVREPLLGRLALESGRGAWHMHQVGGVLRGGVHVASDAPVEGRFAAEPGDELRLFLAVASGYARPDERLTFTVLVGSDRGETRIVETVGAGEARRVVVPADELAPGDGRLRVEVESNVEAGPAVGVVAEAALRRLDDAPPTVLLITSDTHRGDHVGATAAPGLVRTPNIDRLARRGVLFEDCWAQTNITNPSHISLMTGLHPRDTGVTDNRTRLARRAATIAERFAAAGYETRASVSAFHLLDRTSGLGQGFDRMEGPSEPQRDGEVAARRIAGWLEECEGAPAFLWLHVFDAHAPYGPPEPYARRYYGDGDPTEGPAPDYDTGRLPQDQRDVRDLSFLRAEYRAEVDYLDGALRDLLEHPRVERGAVAFTSDHGESLGQHGIWWSHAGLYPDTVHVPLVVRWPGGPEGVRVPGRVAQGDVAATLLAIAGVERGGVGGRDLRAALEVGGPEVPHFVLASNGHAAAVRSGRWLCILTPRWLHTVHMDEPRATGRVELFDLQEDPRAERDLVLEELEVAAELRAALIEWLGRAPAATLEEGPSDLSDADEAMLRGLGYADDASDRAGGGLWTPERFARTPGGWEASPWRRLFEDPGFGADEMRAAMEAAPSGR